MFTISNYGQERERIATESEIAVFDKLVEMSGRDDLRLVRKSNDYVSAVLGDWDVARIKFTPRAKWVVFPVAEPKAQKHRIEDPDDVTELRPLLDQTIEHIIKYL